MKRYQINLRVSNVRDFGFACFKRELKYLCPYSSKKYSEDISIFKFSKLILNNSTGRIFISPEVNFYRPICLKESSFDDHQDVNIRKNIYQNKNIYKNLIEKEFINPVIVFNISGKKRNYYHFFVEDAPHLIWQLETIKGPVDIIVSKDQPKFIIEFLELVSRNFKLKIIYLDPNLNLRVLTPIYICEDTIKRSFGDNPENIATNRKKLFDELKNIFGFKEKKLNIVPTRVQNISPRSWKIVTEDGTDKTKNNTIEKLPSCSAILSLKKFADSFSKNTNTLKIILISREEDSSRGRNIRNDHKLIKAIPKLIKASFGRMSLIDQIKTCSNTNILIGLHGAGLTNMIFLRKKSTIIEIAPELQSLPKSDLFSNLAKICGHDHYIFSSTKLNSKGETFLDQNTIQEIKDLINNKNSF